MKIKPRNIYLLIEREAAQERTATGIYVPQKAADRPLIATVIAVGPEVEDLKKGDKVIYRPFEATSVEVDKQELLLIKEKDILAQVEEK